MAITERVSEVIT